VVKNKKSSRAVYAKNHTRTSEIARGRQRNPKNRSIAETVIGKFKDFFGATLSRFRSPQAALSAIRAGILAVNL
jgi:hypothetical protein